MRKYVSDEHGMMIDEVIKKKTKRRNLLFCLGFWLMLSGTVLTNIFSVFGFEEMRGADFVFTLLTSET